MQNAQQKHLHQISLEEIDEFQSLVKMMDDHRKTPEGEKVFREIMKDFLE